MKLEIRSDAVLELVKNRLGHLLACQEFLDEFLKLKLDEQLIAHQSKSKYAHEREAFAGELERYRKLCRDHALAGEVNPKRSPVVLWLDEVDELETVERMVTTTINLAFGHYDSSNELPDALRRRMDGLTNFDDSE